MEEKQHYSERHRQRSDESRRRKISFAAAYASLWRQRVRGQQSVRGIQVLAAKIAGYGEGSWSDYAGYQTQRTLSARLMKDEIVHAELRRQGMVCNAVTGEWHDPRYKCAG